MSADKPKPVAEDFLRISPKIRVLPIIHGSGDFAIQVREELLARTYDCIAVPLPPSFQDEVEAAVENLPTISAVVQREDEGDSFSYVPIDPCQGVVAGVRVALQERIPRAFIDLETSRFEAHYASFPDPYAIKFASVEGFAAALLPAIGAPEEGSQQARRVVWMAQRLRLLESKYRSILLICSILNWPWIRDAYREKVSFESLGPEEDQSDEWSLASRPVQTFTVDPKTFVFFLAELPFVTALYERSRYDLSDDRNLSIDGVKAMVLEARDKLRREAPTIARRLTPQVLSVFFRYVRNLSLVARRLTPDLYSLIIGAKQTGGDDFALALAEAARTFPVFENSSRGAAEFAEDSESSPLRMGVHQAEVPGWGVCKMVNRLPGQAILWRDCMLRPKAKEKDKRKWHQRWNPYGMCSWPPEDDRIESFQQHVRDQAKAVLGADLARSEKFSSSVKDGIDIRETLRNWHTGDLYVKVLPPNRGSVEVVAFFFDVPADPRKYTHRATWFAEHAEESTLAFYATDPFQNLVGPGIAASEYGGAMFLFPPDPSQTFGTIPGSTLPTPSKSGCWRLLSSTAASDISPW